MPDDRHIIETERIQRLQEEMNTLARPSDGNIDYLRINRLGRQLRDAHLRRGLAEFFAQTRRWLSTWLPWDQARG